MVFGAFRVLTALGVIDRRPTPAARASSEIVTSLGVQPRALGDLSVAVLTGFGKVGDSIERTEERTATRATTLETKLSGVVKNQERLTQRHEDRHEQQTHIAHDIKRLHDATSRIETDVRAIGKPNSTNLQRGTT